MGFVMFGSLEVLNHDGEWTNGHEEVNEVEVTILVQDAKNGNLRGTSVLT
ncbi:hypothetical protein V6Z11_A12G126300 [Gossypium hirsutum]